MTEKEFIYSIIELNEYSKKMHDVFVDEVDFMSEEVENGKQIPIEYGIMFKERIEILDNMVNTIGKMAAYFKG